MEISRDFRELLELLNARGVEFVVVGAHALSFHGAVRSTGDLDLLIKPTELNIEGLIVVLDQFGFSELGITKGDFMDPESVIQLGVAPSRVDLLVSLTGVDTHEVFKEALPGKLGDVPVKFLGREQLLKNKRALGRQKDLADIEALEQK